MSDSDELILKVEVSEDGRTWVLSVYTENGRKIEESEFIMEIEMWLSEIGRAQSMLNDPATQIH